MPLGTLALHTTEWRPTAFCPSTTVAISPSVTRDPDGTFPMRQSVNAYRFSDRAQGILTSLSFIDRVNLVLDATKTIGRDYAVGRGVSFTIRHTTAGVVVEEVAV